MKSRTRSSTAFVLTSRSARVPTSPHFTTVTVSAQKDGYEPGGFTAITCCTTEGDTRHDIRLRRILAITISGPDTLGVGEGAALPINDITLDDGSHQSIYLEPFPSDPSIVAVERGFMGQPGWGVRGVRPGTTIVRSNWQHFEVQLQIQVVNR